MHALTASCVRGGFLLVTIKSRMSPKCSPQQDSTCSTFGTYGRKSTGSDSQQCLGRSCHTA